MLGHTKTHLTENKFIYLNQGNKHYVIPRSIAEKYVIKSKGKSSTVKSTVSSKEVFAHLVSKISEAGALLRGLRTRENMTQLAFAKKINVTQANLSTMESGKRSIGKTVAKRIAKEFDVDYRMFLE